MTSSRRTFLQRAVAAGATVFLGSASGCVGTLGDALGSGKETQSARSTGPQPVVTDLSAPQPTIVNEGRSKNSASDGDQYSATVQNNGAGGEIGVALNWVVSTNAENKPEELQRVTETTFSLDSDGVKSLSFTATQPDGMKGHWFVARPMDVTATVRNHGGSGDVRLQFLISGEVIDEQTVTMRESSTSKFTLSTDSIHPEKDWAVEASPAEASQ